jgi:hypothetical protein
MPSVPSYDPLAAAYYGEFVAYAVEMYFSDISNLTPKPPPGFSALGCQIIGYINAVDMFIDDSLMVFFGYVAQSLAQPNQLVIAIRGTEAALEWLIDFELWPTAFTTIPATGLLVENGFFSVFKTMTFVDSNGDAVRLADLLALVSGDGASLTIVGHSLGGALATMLALDVLYTTPSLKPDTTVYTLASPALGNGAFADYFDATVQTSFRVWNEYDLVPRAFWFYTHVSGGGNAIIQTEQQYDEITFSPPCEHALTTYLWLLDPNNPFSEKFSASCEASNDAARAGRRALRADLGAIPFR